MIASPSSRSFLLLVSAITLVLCLSAFARNDKIRPIQKLQSLTSSASGSKYWSYSSLASSLSLSSSAARPLSNKIWQTAKASPLELDEKSQANIKRWISTNQDWRYELITDYGLDTYVREHFTAKPDIVDVFTSLGDSILRADFFRYLVLLGDGGVYSDLDTECLKPIDQWLKISGESDRTEAAVSGNINSDDNDKAVVGVEFDTFGNGHVGALLDLQLINWTLMSRRPGHGLLQTVVRRVAASLRELAANQSVPLAQIKANFNDVLATTGPAQLTLSTWEYLSKATGAPFDWHNVTGITAPLRVADVIILPVTAWGNGQSHSNAGSPDDPHALVHHQFSGSWKKGSHSWEHVKAAKGMGGSAHKRHA